MINLINSINIFFLHFICVFFVLYLAYHAPIDIYTYLSDESVLLPPSDAINVCVGKEWHRYPSSFFLPDK